MSIRAIGTEPAVALYDSVNGMPLPIEVFVTEEEAEAFLQYALGEQDLDLRRMVAHELAELREQFTKRHVGAGLIARLRDLANAEHEDGVVDPDLSGFAASKAIADLIDNWSDAVAGGAAIIDLVNDVDAVITQLAAFKFAAQRLILYGHGPDHDRPSVRVAYANSMADTAAGAGSN